MIRVDAALFSNVSSAVQRTANLTGGSVRGLPNGIVIEGLKGVTSFSADLADAYKEFKLGRRRVALERVKQIEMQFNGLASRWNGTVGSLISSARTGKQGLSIQKLNEVKGAQSKMVQLTGPATKCFRDLVTALEHEVAFEGHDEVPESSLIASQAPAEADANQSDSGTDLSDAAKRELPGSDVDPDDLGRFADNYSVGPKLRIERGSKGAARVVPGLAEGKFYFCKGTDPPTVIRIRELERSGVMILDTGRSQERLVDSRTLKTWIESGMWLLESRRQ